MSSHEPSNHRQGATSLTRRGRRTGGPKSPRAAARLAGLGAGVLLGLLALAGSGRCDSSRCDPHPAGPIAKQEPQRPRTDPTEANILRSPLDSKDTSEAKQRLVELVRRNLNEQVKDPTREGLWDFWSEGSSRYPLTAKESAYLMSFRRLTGLGQEGFLVICTISGQNTVVHGTWRAPAGIDDIHVMNMGAAGTMIYAVSFDTTHSRRRIHHHVLRHDGARISEVWSFSMSYEVSRPKTYKPVSVSFRDVDKDGVPEVRLRIPGAQTPRLWKRRWALFKWDAPQNEFLPHRGLAFTSAATHKPLWAAFGLLEAVREGSLEDARRFGADRQGCRPLDDIWETFFRRQYRPQGQPRLLGEHEGDKGRRARVMVDLERPKETSRYQAEIELRRMDDETWRVCQVRFFRL
ncbi:MAG: hypothetical protein RBU30_17900 [Polyangia bacterium]|nr:hypothetical protein [Polyangia bacterium]